MKNIVQYGVCISIALMAVLSVTVRPAAADDVKYPSGLWGPDVLALKDEAPAYLPAEFDVHIKPAPANDSPETVAEIAALLRLQAEARTPEEIKAINYEASKAPFLVVLMAGATLDPVRGRPGQFPGQFNVIPDVEYAFQYRNTHELLRLVDHEVSHFIMREKWKYQRARPTQLSDKLTPVITIPSHSAYPSGHAGQSWAAALMLETLDPAHKDVYEKKALDIAHRREIAGLHYPSDSEAGRTLAAAVVPEILKSEKIAALYSSAQQEFTPTAPPAEKKGE